MIDNKVLTGEIVKYLEGSFTHKNLNEAVKEFPKI